MAFETREKMREIKMTKTIHGIHIFTPGLLCIDGPDLPRVDVTAYVWTENGFTVLEKENISLLCQAFSNPPSQYVWLFNGLQISTGSHLTITKILRMHVGNYTCQAKNTRLNTLSERTTTLTVYCEFCFSFLYIHCVLFIVSLSLFAASSLNNELRSRN